MRVSGPDIYFEHEPAPETLRQASVSVFGVPSDTVVVTRMLSDVALHALRSDDVLIIWQRETDDQPGDFPAHYLLEIPASTQNLETLLSHLATATHVPFVVTANDSDPGDIVFYDGDGSRKAFTADLRADEDYAIRLPDTLAVERRVHRPVAI
ncbi:MAG: hypothetical protein QM589_10995 [Thermomicrobiales bacterium]